MSVQAKICGLSTVEALDAAVRGGARFVGFVFYPASPRHLTPERAAALVARVPEGITRVGLFVDPTDSQLAGVTDIPAVRVVSIHGER